MVCDLAGELDCYLRRDGGRLGYGLAVLAQALDMNLHRLGDVSARFRFIFARCNAAGQVGHVSRPIPATRFQDNGVFHEILF
jgi:hypothetical protein